MLFILKIDNSKETKKLIEASSVAWALYGPECGTKVQPSIKGDGEYYTENMTRKSASFVTHDYDM